MAWSLNHSMAYIRTPVKLRTGCHSSLRERAKLTRGRGRGVMQLKRAHMRADRELGGLPDS